MQGKAGSLTYEKCAVPSIYQYGIWIEDAWKGEKQCQGDMSIMEEFAKDDQITTRMLTLANEFRIWMRAIFISDIATIDGQEIPYERIKNDSEWRAEPEAGMHWPISMVPTDEHRQAFRKCLRLTFCHHVSPHSRSNY